MTRTEPPEQPRPPDVPVLLPRPRRIDLERRTVEAREPAVSVGAALPPDGYRLTVADDAVTLDATDAAGAFYGRATLAQLALTHGGRLPAGEIVDWPDFLVRGVMIDISRSKVPTVQTLRALVARLASWKVNQIQLYTEHTFAYAGHDEVWREASPMTPTEIRELDDWCRAHHVELVPNQNCLGHMERWLRHERYRGLALSPEGFEQHGRHRGPSTLDPANPAAFSLVRDLLAELLTHFTSRRVHVGLDEPWELPAERADDYVDWLGRLRALPELSSREMLVWGDILADHPALIERLPAGVTVCEWGYDDFHPFEQRCAALAAARRPFWVCPGTSAWLSILGRSTNMLGNCAAAAEAGLRHGAAGFLDTDWGDWGHLQYLPVSEPGLAYGAAVSWCLDSNRDLDLAAALDVHCYEDEQREIGGVLLRLGDAYRCSQVQVPNIAATLLHLWFPQWAVGGGPFGGFTRDEFVAVEKLLDDALPRLGRARPGRADGALVLDELRNACALVRVLCHDAVARLAADGTLGSVPEARRLALAAELEGVIAEHRRLWQARNRPGGLPESVRVLEHLVGCYRSGEPPADWPPD